MSLPGKSMKIGGYNYHVSDRGEGEVGGHDAGRGAGIDPGELEGGEGGGEAPAALERAAVLGVQGQGADAGLVEEGQQAVLLRRPVVGAPAAGGWRGVFDPGESTLSRAISYSV